MRKHCTHMYLADSARNWYACWLRLLYHVFNQLDRTFLHDSGRQFLPRMGMLLSIAKYTRINPSFYMISPIYNYRDMDAYIFSVYLGIGSH